MTVKGKAAGNSARFIFVFLGLLTAFGPFVTDMYLPSLPVMTAYFDTSVSMVQTGLTFSMLGLVFGQLVFGPLSDAYGRRPPLLVSLVLFVAATFACIFAPTIEVFAALRFLQGIAASGGIVIARSIAADKFKRKIWPRRWRLSVPSTEWRRSPRRWSAARCWMRSAGRAFLSFCF